MTWLRILGPLLLGTAIGLALGRLPEDWQPWLVVVICAGGFVYAVHSIRWSQRQQREIAAQHEELERMLEELSR